MSIGQQDAPVRALLRNQLERLAALDRLLDSPGAHGPALRRPCALCATWLITGARTARRAGTAGFEALATLVDPGTYLTPNWPSTVNPFVSTPGPFYWCGTNVFSELSWTYTYQPKVINTDVITSTLNGALTSSNTTITVVDATAYPASGYVLIDSEIIQYTGGGGGGTTLTGATRGSNGSTAVSHSSGATVYSLTSLTAPVVGKIAADLFDPAIQSNGGAIILDNFAGVQKFTGAIKHPRINCEIDIYDKTRNRSLTSGRLPVEEFCSGAYGYKKIPTEPMRMEHGTQLEPRLYVTEAALMAIMEETGVFIPASVRFYVTMVFKGYTVSPPPARYAQP